MLTDIDLASFLVSTPGTVAAVLAGGAAIVAVIYAVAGLAVTAEINRTILAINQTDTPAR